MSNFPDEVLRIFSRDTLESMRHDLLEALEHGFEHLPDLDAFAPGRLLLQIEKVQRAELWDE